MNSKSIIYLDKVSYDDFVVVDSSGSVVTGLGNGDFTRDLYNPSGSEVSGSITVTISELGDGKYRASWTPNAEGDWVLTVYHATHFPAGKSASYMCESGVNIGHDVQTMSVINVNSLTAAPDINVVFYDTRGRIDLTDSHINSAGSYSVYRFRDGSVSTVDTGTPSSVASECRIHVPITISNFQVGDVGNITVTGVEIQVGSTTYYPGTIQSTFQIVGDLDENITAIKDKTDNLPTDPADQSQVETAISNSESTITAAISTTESNIRGADSDTLETISDQIDTIPTSSTIAGDVWDEAISGHTTASTFGAKNQRVVPSETLDDYKADVSALATEANATTNTTNIIAEVDANETKIDAIKTKTDNLPTDPADQSQVESAISSSESTITSAISSTETNIRGADSDTLETLSDQLDAVHAKTTNLPSDPADQSQVESAISSSESTITSAISSTETNIRGTDSDTLETLSDQIDSTQTLIKQLRQGNVSYEFAAATVEDATRKVAVGALDHMIIKIKNDGDSDWSSPVSTKTLYYWYGTLGDVNPVYVKEDG